MKSRGNSAATARCSLVIVGNWGTAWLWFIFWLRVLDKAEYSAFESTLNSAIVSYRIYHVQNNAIGLLDLDSIYLNASLLSIPRVDVT